MDPQARGYWLTKMDWFRAGEGDGFELLYIDIFSREINHQQSTKSATWYRNKFLVAQGFAKATPRKVNVKVNLAFHYVHLVSYVPTDSPSNSSFWRIAA